MSEFEFAKRPKCLESLDFLIEKRKQNGEVYRILYVSYGLTHTSPFFSSVGFALKNLLAKVQASHDHLPTI